MHLEYWQATADHCGTLAGLIGTELASGDTQKLGAYAEMLITIVGSVKVYPTINELWNKSGQDPEVFSRTMGEWCADDLASRLGGLPEVRR